MGKKIKKEETFVCPNCANTESKPVYEGLNKIEDQSQCTNCGYVLTKEK